MSATLFLESPACFADEAGTRARIVMTVEGMRCAGCVRGVEAAVRRLPGICDVSANVATSRVVVDWDREHVDLSALRRAISGSGFRVVPFSGTSATARARHERRTALKRLGLAALGMMQVMMYVMGVYVAGAGGIDPAAATYLQLVAMLITTPVLLYSGAPFFTGAWRDLRRHRLGMDVPVALALGLAYAASVLNTLRGAGPTYFDSVTMFIFFLGLGRHVELSLRQRSLSVSEAVARSLPGRVTRIARDGSAERIPVEKLSVGDRLSIARGGVIPVDATLESEHGLVDESLVSGESTGVARDRGASLLGGSVNCGDAIQVVVTHDLGTSTLSTMAALVEVAQRDRRYQSDAAERIANVLIFAVVVLAATTALAWWHVDPSRALPAALAVLVVTCPCALSLATPAAVAAAATRLARMGIVIARAGALQRLARADTVVLDKTGTLTTGWPELCRVRCLDGLDELHALRIAAALERASDHPMARMFLPHQDPAIVATNLREIAGKGVEGCIVDERWRIGQLDFVAPAGAPLPGESGTGVWLGNSRGLVAQFETSEQMQPRAAEAVVAFHAFGIKTVLASGDSPRAVARVANELHIGDAHARLDPRQKVALVERLTGLGRSVLAVGDGVNDGPLLAAANVSCAMAQGSALAQAAADVVSINDSLTGLTDAIATARRMARIDQQNIAWAVLYNLAAVPLAAIGVVPPWLAAIGMSLSSLAVVLNAGRLARG